MEAVGLPILEINNIGIGWYLCRDSLGAPDEIVIGRSKTDGRNHLDILDRNMIGLVKMLPSFLWNLDRASKDNRYLLSVITQHLGKIENRLAHLVIMAGTKQTRCNNRGMH